MGGNRTSNRPVELFGDKCSLNELLSKYTTIDIGGPADIFLNVEKEKDLIWAVKKAEKYNIDYLVLGKGSNILVSDEGFRGLVIHNNVSGTKLVKNRVIVKSGTILQELISKLISKGLAGMECMAGIPGTVGGAVVGNAGAYGQQISDRLLTVKVFSHGKIKLIKKEEAFFDYRKSVFKKGNQVILEIEFEFEKGSPKRLRNVSEKILNLRSAKYPDGLKCPGSFYKNVEVSKLDTKVVKMIPKEKVVHGKIAAGYLMERVGAKGKSKGGITIAYYHGNLIINKNNGQASDFLELANHYASKVKNKYGIKLEPEVVLLGFDKLEPVD